jgi:hypothetical protein
LLDERRKTRIGREDNGACKAAVEIGGDRLRFEQLEVPWRNTGILPKG